MPKISTPTWLVSLIGPPEETPLRKRIFHSANLLTCVMLLVVFTVNIFNRVYGAAALVLVIGAAHAFFFYLSRVRNNFTLALAGFVVMCYAGAFANYFINDGINGPTLFIFFFTFLLLVAVNRVRYHGYFIMATCGLVAALLFTELTHPGWIATDYTDDLARVVNVLLVFVIVLLSFYWVSRALIDNYYIEKKKADKRAAELEIQHRKLHQLAEEKDKLFSMVFHDLKSPLVSVQLYLQAIADKGIDLEADRRLRDNLLQLTKDTSSMLERVLTWISEQLDDKPGDLQPVNVADLITACLRIERPFAEAKGIAIACRLADDNTARADPMMLQLMLRIVINNAIKFSHTDGRVTVYAHRSADQYLISVTDDGVGIPPEEQSKLFSMGISATRGTNNEFGNGLGLMLAKQFADKQGIKIHYMSTPGRGTSFTFVLPVSTP